MDEDRLKQYLSGRYQGCRSFLEEIIFPIFGKESFEDNFETDLLEAQKETQSLAKQTGIKSIKNVGEVPVGVDLLHIFDITVSDRVLMERNRVNVQRVIRRVMQPYSSAFMIFHYDDDSRWEWRFSYCHKGATDKETTDNKRYTFLLGPGQSCRTATENFLKLAEKHEDIEVDDIERAFDVEALSKEFFGKYKEQYEKFVSYVTGKKYEKSGGKYVEKKVGEPHTVMYAAFKSKIPADVLDEDKTKVTDKLVRDYTKQILGRITFLHFLQKKGWLGVPAGGKWGDGDQQFMRNLFVNASEEQKADFLDVVLEPLFDKGLDTDRSADGDLFDTGVELQGGSRVRVPYLNGGLFERNSLDEIDTQFPAEFFEELLDFFYQYNFTIDENDPNEAQVGVDPEMLGRIFENLLEDNKDKGAFYTPKEIVRYMCRQSLTAYLQSDVTGEQKDAVAQFVETYDVSFLDGGDSELAKKLDQKLKDVKICDPAIGSGAFPMGLLKELFMCRGAIEHFDNAADIKRHIIQQNIYGVDIERGAVDIARLRFWLSLIVDETSPAALPNLDYKIMQGNSLLESYYGIDLSQLATKSSDMRIHEPQRNLFGEIEDRQMIISFESSEALTEFQDNVKRYYEVSSHSDRAKLREQIERFVKQSILRTLEGRIESNRLKMVSIGGSVNLSEKQQAEISKLEEENKRLEAQSHKTEESPIINSDFFLWHTWFNDVFSRPSKEGFDIVIGNPPYVEAKKLKGISVALKPYYRVYSGTADLSIYFSELSFNLLAPEGISCFITTNKFFTTGYGKSVRELYSIHHLNKIIDFEQVEVFEDILVSSVIIEARNVCKVPNNQFTYEKFYKLDKDTFRNEFVSRQKKFGVYSQEFINNKEWSFADNNSLLLKEKIETESTCLGELEGVKIYRGVTTGFNPAFIINKEQKDSLVESNAKCSELIKEMLQGRNIRKWYYNDTNEYLIFTRKGIDISLYPNIEKHLSCFYNQLRPKTEDNQEEGRKPGKYNWYEILDNTAYYKEFEQESKIIWGLTADKWAYSLDRGKHYLPSNAFILSSKKIDILYVLGMLNSKLMHYYFKFIGVMTAGGAYTLKGATISMLPFKIMDDTSVIAKIVNNILKIKASNHDADVSSLEKDIDCLVYRLYNLTKEEIIMIEDAI